MSQYVTNTIEIKMEHSESRNVSHNCKIKTFLNTFKNIDVISKCLNFWRVTIRVTANSILVRPQDYLGKLTLSLK